MHSRALLGVEPEGVFALQLLVYLRNRGGVLIGVILVDKRRRIENLHMVTEK